MKQTLLLFLLVIVFFSGCNNPKIILDETQPINSDNWFADSVVNFNVLINDTNHPYDIYLTTTNTNLYNFQNLYLFVSIKFPHNIVRVDTIDCFLADNKGKWYGKEHDDKYFQKLLYRRKIIFPFPGSYQFTITQAMRQNPLEGFHAIGIIIEESKKK